MKNDHPEYLRSEHAHPDHYCSWFGWNGSADCAFCRRMVYDMKAARLHTPQIVLIDPDKVEQKNVGRQLYVEADVGQAKADILMRRFNMALSWTSSPLTSR